MPGGAAAGMLRQIRLWSGLVVAVFVVSHLINHSLGFLSLEAMDAYRKFHSAVWQNPVGTIALYGALLAHLLLALYSLYIRSHLRMRAWEAAQLVLGLAVPPLLIGHVIGTRIASELGDFDATYAYVVSFLWLEGARLTWKQSFMIVVVWSHLVLGLHFWLRVKPWYPKALPVLYPLAALIPILAWFGFARAGMSVAVMAETPGYLEKIRAGLFSAPPSTLQLLGDLRDTGYWIMAGMLALTLGARQARRLYRNRRGAVEIEYPAGRKITVPVGHTILEASRAYEIPHASVCGGRGRCTTCRVAIDAGLGDLPAPEALEAKALKRIKADPNVRLACQTRPRRRIAITPLLPPNATARDGRLPGGVQGKEQQVAILFVDLRASTKLGEERMPYDVVFILNQFFAEMAEALKATGGHYAQFNGDGLMALYGLESGFESGCREAIRGAVEMQRRIDALNENFGRELAEPLRIGVGVHSGEAIVGSMGPPASPIISAIGDNVNVSARLEGMTKDYQCGLVVSAATAERAGIDLSRFPRHDAELRGREESIAIYAIPADAKIEV